MCSKRKAGDWRRGGWGDYIGVPSRFRAVQFCRIAIKKVLESPVYYFAEKNREKGDSRGCHNASNLRRNGARLKERVESGIGSYQEVNNALFSFLDIYSCSDFGVDNP